MKSAPDYGPSDRSEARLKGVGSRARLVAARNSQGFRIEMGPNADRGSEVSDSRVLSRLSDRARRQFASFAAVGLILGQDPSSGKPPQSSEGPAPIDPTVYRGPGSATDISLPENGQNIQITPPEDIQGEQTPPEDQ